MRNKLVFNAMRILKSAVLAVWVILVVMGMSEAAFGHETEVVVKNETKGLKLRVMTETGPLADNVILPGMSSTRMIFKEKPEKLRLLVWLGDGLYVVHFSENSSFLVFDLDGRGRETFSNLKAKDNSYDEKPDGPSYEINLIRKKKVSEGATEYEFTVTGGVS